MGPAPRAARNRSRLDAAAHRVPPCFVSCWSPIYSAGAANASPRRTPRPPPRSRLVLRRGKRQIKENYLEFRQNRPKPRFGSKRLVCKRRLPKPMHIPAAVWLPASSGGLTVFARNPCIVGQNQGRGDANINPCQL